MNLHIVRNSVTYDSRVLKETESLYESKIIKQLEICGLANSGDLQEEFLDHRKINRITLKSRPLSKVLATQIIKYIEWYWRVIKLYRAKSIDVIHCHDLSPLPIAATLKKLTGAKLIYDAHELESEQYGLSSVRKVLSRNIERMFIPFVDIMITVSPSIMEWYKERFPNLNIYLVRNIPLRTESPISSAKNLRSVLKIPDDALLFIYLGGLSKGRGIENSLSAFQDADVRHHIVYMGSGPLLNKILKAKESCTRIHHLEPVSPNEVVNYTASADIGLCLYEDTCLNHRYCLPNKLFETLIAGVPVLASNLPDQSAIVNKYSGGWIVDNNLGELIKFLREITIIDAKSRRDGLLDRVSTLTWANEAKTLLNCYAELLAR